MTQGALQSTQATSVLVIEDDLDTREFYEMILLSQGYQVHAAGTGQAALAQAATHPVQAIVLDRRLPDFDSVNLCRLLRHRLGTELPIIFVTADRDPALEGTARTAGITDFLLKPFDPTELLERVRRLTSSPG